jgi:hypothetical protein
LQQRLQHLPADRDPHRRMQRQDMQRYVYSLTFAFLALVLHVHCQGLDPSGRLGVSPADAEKCDGFKRRDFAALLLGANMLSVAKHVLDQPVLPAAKEPPSQDAKDCAIGSTWDQLELQLHAAFSPPAYAADDKRLNPMQANFFPSVRDQVGVNNLTLQLGQFCLWSSSGCKQLSSSG